MPQIHANGIKLEVELRGPENGRVLVLVSGLERQLVHWGEDLLRALADAGHRVVVFDNRDVGLSTHLAGTPAPSLVELRAAIAEGRDPEVPYRLTDLAADLLGLLDALELPSVHVMGMSMGGMIAQEAALLAPERFDSLISMMSTSDEPGLPPPAPEAADALLGPVPSEREAYVERKLEMVRALAGPAYPLDEAAVRAMWGAAFDRCFDPAGILRQVAAIGVSRSRRQRLRSLRVPTLVIHGDADPLVPLACGRATAAAVPDATLRTVAGMGHEISAGVVPEIVAAVTAHTRAHDIVSRTASL